MESISHPITYLSESQTRREFLRRITKLGLTGFGISFFPVSRLLQASDLSRDSNLEFLIRNAHPARFWVSSDDPSSCSSCHELENTPSPYNHSESQVQCRLCAMNCMIKEGERGICRARINVDGELKTLVYGHPVSVHIDPIEKKPFFHFLPGSQAMSMATTGCPLKCRFCQNWEISQAAPEDFRTSVTPPDAMVNSALNQSTPILAFTYNEPTVFFEYLMDIAQLAREFGIRSVMISCGYMNPEPLGEICRVLDGLKIDLKGFSPDFYKKVCAAELKPVLTSIRNAAQSNIHLEIVNLVVPTLNDSEKMLQDLCRWIVDEAGPDVPVHFTRFHPNYQMQNLPPTPVTSLEKAYEIARIAGIRYPYVGNVPGHSGNSTYCHSCGKIVIRRKGFFVLENNMTQGRCKYCQTEISGVWE